MRIRTRKTLKETGMCFVTKGNIYTVWNRLKINVGIFYLSNIIVAVIIGMTTALVNVNMITTVECYRSIKT